LKQEDIELFSDWNNNETKFVELRNVIKDCQISGRPYFGITFEFKNNILTEIYAGYPY